MSYDKLVETLKHLQGQHNQAEHAPYKGGGSKKSKPSDLDRRFERSSSVVDAVKKAGPAAASLGHFVKAGFRRHPGQSSSAGVLAKIRKDQFSGESQKKFQAHMNKLIDVGLVESSATHYTLTKLGKDAVRDKID